MMENKTKIDLKNKSIFITGVAGFIGSNLAKRLLSTVEGVKVVGLDNMNHYYDVRLKEARLNEYMDAQEVMHMTDYSKITALYSRLSVGDEDRDGGESNSIELMIGQSSTEAERKRAARLENKALLPPRTNGGHLSDIRPPEMHISYKPLWHTLLERDMRKEDLRLAAGMTTNMIPSRFIPARPTMDFLSTG